MKPTYKELQKQLTESRREFTAANATIHNLELKVAQVVAENVALKSAFDKPDAWLSWHSIPPTFYEPDRGGEYLQVHEKAGEKNDDGSDSWPVYSNPNVVTPATDAYLAEVRAQGVEMFALMFAEEAIKTNNITTGWRAKASRAASEYAEALREDAAQLRQGAAL